MKEIIYNGRKRYFKVRHNTFKDKKYKVNLSKDAHGNTFIRNIREVEIS